MTEGSLEESGLDPQTFMLVCIAALTVMDSAPASWPVNLKVGCEAGLVPVSIVGVLVAIAPVVGSIVRALGPANAVAGAGNGDASD